MISTIAYRELRALFISPLGWVILAVLQAILAWVFFVQVDQFLALQTRLSNTPGAPGVTALIIAPSLRLMGVLFLLIVPLFKRQNDQ